MAQRNSSISELGVYHRFAVLCLSYNGRLTELLKRCRLEQEPRKREKWPLWLGLRVQNRALDGEGEETCVESPVRPGGGYLGLTSCHRSLGPV